MTEEEAKTKWCPFVRAPIDGSPKVANRGLSSGHYLPGTACIGSACMAWRVLLAEQESLIDAIKRHRNENGSALYEAKNYVEAHPEYRKGIPAGGYCGLAGKP